MQEFLCASLSELLIQSLSAVWLLFVVGDDDDDVVGGGGGVCVGVGVVGVGGGGVFFLRILL